MSDESTCRGLCCTDWHLYPMTAAVHAGVSQLTVFSQSSREQKLHVNTQALVCSGLCVVYSGLMRYDTMCRWCVRGHWTHSRCMCGVYALDVYWMCWQGMKGRWLDLPSALPSHCLRLRLGTRLYAPGMSSGVVLLSTLHYAMSCPSSTARSLLAGLVSFSLQRWLSNTNPGGPLTSCTWVIQQACLSLSDVGSAMKSGKTTDVLRMGHIPGQALRTLLYAVY